MSFDPKQPYNDLPPLPPAVELESKAVLKQCIGARAALEGLKQAAELIPNQAMLINTLPMLEAQASSEIENIVTTTDRLFQYAGSGGATDPATKEALRYRTAMKKASDALRDRPITTNLAEAICSDIKGIEMKVRTVPGTTLASSRSGDTIYTPPVGEALLRDKLANWECFLNENQDLDPLVRMAVMHYQFEAIHPFTDGNGRTGRILNTLYLTQEDLLALPILYLSRYIIAHKDQYYAGLLAVTREAAWEQWLLYMLRAVETTAQWTMNKIRAIRDLSEHTADHVKKTLPKIYSRELIDVIFQQPYCRIGNLVDADVAKRQTASEYLKKLAMADVLIEQKSGRDLVFVHTRLLQLLREESNSFTPYPQNDAV
jgi:Fic family protein